MQLNLSMSVAPMQPSLITASDVTPMYGVTSTLFYPIRSQYSHNLQQPDLKQGHSGGGAGKGKRACKYISGI